MIKINAQATKAHLVVGAVLVGLSLACLIADLFLQMRILSVAIFFLGVWGGVELGRYLEHWLTTREPTGVE